MSIENWHDDFMNYATIQFMIDGNFGIECDLFAFHGYMQPMSDTEVLRAALTHFYAYPHEFFTDMHFTINSVVTVHMSRYNSDYEEIESDHTLVVDNTRILYTV